MLENRGDRVEEPARTIGGSQAAPVAISTRPAWEVTLDDAREYAAALARNRTVVWVTTGILMSITVVLVAAADPALSPGSALLFAGLGAALCLRNVRRYLVRASEAQLRPPLPWRELEQLESAAAVRDLDDPAARTHRPLSKEERLQRFHASILERLRSSPRTLS